MGGHDSRGRPGRHRRPRARKRRGGAGPRLTGRTRRLDAIVLVGGQGTRLRPLTLTRHKSLVPLCNRPAIGYLFDWLQEWGFERVILALGQGNEDLARAFPPGSLDRSRLVHVLEAGRLESGGAIRNAVRETKVEDRFAVVNGDIYIELEFFRLLEAHAAAGAELTLALCKLDDPAGFGVAVTDRRQRITRFVEKPAAGSTPSKLVNAGVWVFEPHLVREIPPGPVRVEEALFPALVDAGRHVLGFEFDGHWADLGTPERYLQLNRVLLETGRAGQGGVAIAEGVDAGGARVALSSLGQGCRPGPGSSISGSILWEGVEVGAGALVRDSILADGVHIGPRARVEGAVLGRGARVAAGSQVAPGARLPPGALYDGGDADKPG